MTIIFRLFAVLFTVSFINITCLHTAVAMEAVFGGEYPEGEEELDPDYDAALEDACVEWMEQCALFHECVAHYAKKILLPVGCVIGGCYVAYVYYAQALQKQLVL